MRNRTDLWPATRLRHLADGALLVEYPDAGDEEANGAAVALGGFLRRRFGEPMYDAIPGARTLFCEFDPRRLPHEMLAAEIGRAAPETDPAAAPRERRIPVLYGGDAGADLGALARAAGISAEELAARHAAAVYRVAFLGFAPGFAYMTGLPSGLEFPRLATPRTRVPAGALAVAGPYTGIYPAASPGGWNLIGAAAVRMFEPGTEPPATLLPGDRVIFDPVSPAEFEAASSEAEAAEGAQAEAEGTPLFRVGAAGVWAAVCGGPRHGSGAWGVPPGGAMDALALEAGNRALGNPAAAPALEIAATGPTLDVLAGVIAVVSGAPCDVTLDGSSVAFGEPFRAAAGQRLKIGAMRSGLRSYLCVAGGLQLPDRGRLPERLRAGDAVSGAGEGEPPRRSETERSAAPAWSEPAEPVVRIVLGPQSERFSPKGVLTLLASSYRVSSAGDRRGVRLDGPALEASGSGGSEVPPEGTALGAIQVPPDGQPIVLGPDRPVTGGYAKIATVIGADFRLVAQARPGSMLRFRPVGLAEALDARLER